MPDRVTITDKELDAIERRHGRCSHCEGFLPHLVWAARSARTRIRALETILRAISERHDDELAPMDAKYPRSCGCPDCLLIDAALAEKPWPTA